MSPASPPVSIVVSTRNREDQLAELLEALRNQSLPATSFEVVVVDDASRDDTAGLLDRELERGGLDLRVLRRESPGGAALGREQGWRAARGGLIAFTDDDCVPEAGWVEAGLEATRANPGSVIQGPTRPRPDQLDRTGPFSRTIDVSGLDYNFQTTNVFYPRDLLERVGGFDTEAFAESVGGEDTDLAWRAIGAGAQVVFRADAVVYHAVNDLGPMGKLRVAARQSAVIPYVRHPEVRRAHFVRGIFRKPTHYWLALALVALVPRGRLRLLALPLVVPYLRSLYARGKLEGGGPAMAPYFLLHDLVEVYATVAGSLRSGRLLI